jgi:TetR/AcrR family transcriptional regulator
MRTIRTPSDNSIEVRERILDAAQQAFAEKGFDGATTRQIASRANVPLGLLRYYFGDKLKLWQAAVDEAFDEIRKGLDVAVFFPEGKDGDVSDNASDTPDPVSAIRAGIRAHVFYVAQHPEFVRLMHDEGKRRGPRMRWLVDRHVKPLYAAIKIQMRRAQAQGYLPDDVDPIHFHYILAGSVGFIFHQAEECKRLSGIDPFDETTIENHSRVVEYFFLGPPKDSD